MPPPQEIAHFCIFDDRLGSSEGKEHEKIMYYYPQATPIPSQTVRVGLAEAFIHFTSMFSPQKPCEAVHTEKHTSAYVKCEPNYWIIMIVQNPHVTGPDNKLEYIEDFWDDEALNVVASQAYKTFRVEIL